MTQMSCITCFAPFVITDDDRAFYISREVPEPTMCPDCRHQRRLLFRNENALYHRNCSRCKKPIISIFSPESGCTVYCSECFWSDTWDPLSYGMPIDFNRPFFDQLKELRDQVPFLGNTVFNSINSEYNSFCTDSKDCYMSARVASENCMYSYLVLDCLSCVDCMDVYKCQYCYECVDCWNSYQCYFSQLCRDASDCVFCYDCIGCRNCFGCVGLRNAEYHFFNKKYTKQEYEELMKQYSIQSFSGLTYIKDYTAKMMADMPRRAVYHMNTQNVRGDYITESKNVALSFDVEKSDTVRYSWGVEYAKDITDSDFIYYGEDCFNSISNSKSTHCDYCFAMLGGMYDCLYSMLLFNNSHDCFGCISLKKGSYSILNKQYEKNEYFALKAKLIEHMKKPTSSFGGAKDVYSGPEWGRFFPPYLSCFGYNETIAATYFPLSQKEALAQGFNWYEAGIKEYQPSTYEISDTIVEVPHSIVNEVLACTNCGKNYKLVAQELRFYKDFSLPVPRQCPDCRRMRRVDLRNPRKLWERNCEKCNKSIESSYAPDRSEKIYCEECYTEFVY